MGFRTCALLGMQERLEQKSLFDRKTNMIQTDKTLTTFKTIIICWTIGGAERRQI